MKIEDLKKALVQVERMMSLFDEVYVTLSKINGELLLSISIPESKMSDGETDELEK